jgi:protein-disulfide isomerase
MAHDTMCPGQGTMAGVNDSTPDAPDPTPAPDPAADPAPDPADSAPDAPAGITPPAPARTDGRRGRAAYGAVVLGLALALGAGFAIGRVTAPAGGVEPDPSVAAGSPAPTGLATLPNDGPRLGSPDAAVVVDYWADYQCPFCSKFADEVIPALESRIADGTVLLVHRDLAFLGPESIDAAVAVRCAAREDRYWQMHDAVYAAQQGENQGAFSRDRLALVAASVGLDKVAFEACLDERAPLVDVLDDTATGVRAGIASTPTVVVNGTRFLGVPDIAQVLAAIDEAAAGASPAPSPTKAPSTDAWSATETDGRTAGRPDAPVTVELWMDYQSPDSEVVARQLGPELRTRLDAGDIRAELRDLAALGDESVVAATFLACVVEQDGPAWLVHDVLSVSGRGAGSGIYTPENVLRVSAQLGLDVRALDACLDDAAVEDAVKAGTANGVAAGITEAPTVVIRRGDTELGRYTAPLDVAEIVAAIDKAK